MSESSVSKRTLWRLIVVTLICAACGYFFLPLHKVRLGLDLQGGVHFELEVQGHEALEADLRDTRDRLLQKLQEKGLASATARAEGLALQVDGVPADQRPAVEKILEGFPGYKGAFQGEQLVLTQLASHQKSLKDDANKRALQIIEKRINQFGVAEPEITPSGREGNRIIVELPGVNEAERERIKGLLATPGRLEQRLVAKGTSPRGYVTREEALAALGGTLNPEWEILPEPETEHNTRLATGRQATPGAAPAKAAEEKVHRWYVVENRVQVDGKDIIDAHRAPNPQTEQNEINFTLNRTGTDAFYQATKVMADEGRLIAVVLDRKIASVLSAREPIPGGSVRVSGSFTEAEADDFAMKLRSGAMRASMKFLEEKSMGPSLGADAIKAGVTGSALGFGAIILFMVFWYHWSGVNAIVALTINTVVMLGLLGSFNAVLTLPGIAGFALTLGMAVDANILIFERIREELSHGKSVSGAIQAGFDRVFWTIVDSHVTQLFAALLLFIFGTGPVKGFAVTLTVGVVASLFTSIYISRYIYDWVLEHNPTTRLSIGHLTIFKDAKFPFMKWKGLALSISWGIIVICILSAQPWKGGNHRVKLGMQFVGGVDVMVRFKGKVPQDQVRSALYQGGLSNAAVVAYTDKPEVTDFSIKVKATKGQDEKEATTQFNQIKGILQKLDPAAADPRIDLNMAPVGDLTTRWAKANPLGIQGEDEAVQAGYQPWVAKIISARDTYSPLTSFAQLPQDLPAQLRQDLESNYRLGPMVVLKNESFSPSISGEWTQKTLTAVAWALGAILVYVMFRFTASFAIGGIVSLVHDILMALGLFVLFGFEFSVPVVASFLILIGYSMSDTIVVFDRIRENSHKPEYRRVSISKLVDDSINQTLSRTILTSCSVLFVAVCLFFWGGPALRDLSFPIMIGVITGTYSSIYIASPVVVLWEKWFPHEESLKQKHT
jgi:protein-export membrane protein SecD/preprotein translocase SecF subunit